VRDRGELDRTIFVLCGDNGLALGQHGLMGKQSLYDHSVRVPLVFSGPGIPAGQTSDAPVYLLDIFPTLCALTGTPVPSSVEGQNVFTSSREAVYLAYRDLHRGVRTRQHKLIEYVVNGQHTMTQVFDVLADPLETRNLADDAALVEMLRRQLFRLRDDWDDRASPWGQTFWTAFPEENTR
jgi:arylsulfatase A-like enzyme